MPCGKKYFFNYRRRAYRLFYLCQDVSLQTVEKCSRPNIIADRIIRESSSVHFLFRPFPLWKLFLQYRLHPYLFSFFFFFFLGKQTTVGNIRRDIMFYERKVTSHGWTSTGCISKYLTELRSTKCWKSITNLHITNKVVDSKRSLLSYSMRSIHSREMYCAYIMDKTVRWTIRCNIVTQSSSIRYCAFWLH